MHPFSEPCHDCDTCPATYKDMIPNYEMSREGGRWFYFTCKLCNRLTFIMRRDVDLTNPKWRPAINSKYTSTRAAPEYLKGKHGSPSMFVHHIFPQKKTKPTARTYHLRKERLRMQRRLSRNKKNPTPRMNTNRRRARNSRISCL